MGLVLIGMPGLEKRLSRYPQLYSRVWFVHQYRSLCSKEASDLLKYQVRKLGVALRPEQLSDTEATAAIIRVTGSNFRLIQMLLTQIERIMKLNGLHRVKRST